MTNEEVLKILKDGMDYMKRNIERQEIAINALEKQIPKKRVPIDSFRFCCPACKKMQIENEEGWSIYYEFCPYCGQAISL